MKIRFAKKSILCLTMVTGMLAGCKKDHITPVIDQDSPSQPATLHLHEEILDSGNLKVIFTPDKSMRLGVYTVYFNGGKTAESNYTYDASGNLTKVTKPGNSPSRTEYFYADGKLSNGKFFNDWKTKDSLDQLWNMSYKVGSNGLVIRNLVYSGTSNELSQEYYYEYDTRGNLTKTSEYSWYHGEKQFKGTREYTYDNYRNPYSTFKSPWYLYGEPIVNNPLSYTFKNGMGEVIDFYTCTYEYNSDSLPIKKTTTTKFNHQSETRYIYTK